MADWQELMELTQGRANVVVERVRLVGQGHRHRGRVRAAAARPPRRLRPGLRRGLRAQPWLDQGDGACVRRLLSHDQGAAEPHRCAAGIRRHQSRPDTRRCSRTASRGARSAPKTRSANWRGWKHDAADAGAVACRAQTGRRLSLWLPLFLFWLIALPFVIVTLPVVAIVLVLLGRNPLRVFAAYWSLLSAIPGSHFEIESGRGLVFLHVY